MMRRWLVLAALLLPLVATAARIGWLSYRALGSTAYVIPVSGYDPRDPLRGRYIRFQYDWQLDGSARQCHEGGGCDLCLSGDGERLVARIVEPGADCPQRVDVRGSRIIVGRGFGSGPGAIFSSRIFVSESRAPELERQLQEGPMAIEAELGRDGRLRPRRMVPRG